MELKSQDILFASLLGSKILRTSNNLNLVQNELQKHVLPSLPVYVQENQSAVLGSTLPGFGYLNRSDAPLSEDQQFFPMSLSIDNGATWFLLPYEPLLNIQGKNNIVRRNVAKWRADVSSKDTIGSIKERWNQDDYELTITGVLMGSLLSGDVSDCFPRADFEKLRDVLTHPKEILVKCEPLQLLGINRMVIEDMSYPFTKGENVQAYEIKGYSDGSYNLLREL